MKKIVFAYMALVLVFSSFAITAPASAASIPQCQAGMDVTPKDLWGFQCTVTTGLEFSITTYGVSLNAKGAPIGLFVFTGPLPTDYNSSVNLYHYGKTGMVQLVVKKIGSRYQIANISGISGYTATDTNCIGIGDTYVVQSRIGFDLGRESFVNFENGFSVKANYVNTDGQSILLWQAERKGATTTRNIIKAVPLPIYPNSVSVGTSTKSDHNTTVSSNWTIKACGGGIISVTTSISEK